MPVEGQQTEQALLEERARRLALPIQTAEIKNTIDVVTFSIGQEKYIIESAYVMEINKLRAYTPVPGTPNFVFGITNIRGVIVAVIDLRKFLTLPTRGVTDLTRVITLGEGQFSLGILAQTAEESYPLDRSLILPPPDNTSAGTRKYLKGVTADAALFIDAKLILNDERLTIDQSQEA